MFFAQLFLIFAQLLQVVGGFALIGLLIYGIYTIFATSIGLGLMMIGGAVVGAWILALVTGLLFASGEAILNAVCDAAESDDI
jgi:hypothetical protein